MDSETKQMFELIIGKLDKMDARLDKMDARLDKVDARLDKMDARLDKVDARLDKMDARLDKVDARLDKMDTRLDTVEKTQKAMVVKIDELYAIARATEENIKVTRAEQEKIAFQVADIQGKVNSLTGEVQEHEHIIQQIRAIK